MKRKLYRIHGGSNDVVYKLYCNLSTGIIHITKMECFGDYTLVGVIKQADIDNFLTYYCMKLSSLNFKQFKEELSKFKI